MTEEGGMHPNLGVLCGSLAGETKAGLGPETVGPRASAAVGQLAGTPSSHQQRLSNALTPPSPQEQIYAG